jgi:hypothetical protein
VKVLTLTRKKKSLFEQEKEKAERLDDDEDGGVEERKENGNPELEDPNDWTSEETKAPFL